MAYINVAESGQFVQLDINNSGAFANAATAMADTSNVYSVPALQEVTVNATPGIFRWKQLDSLSEYAITTSSTNSVECTLVLDDSTFFSAQGSSTGIFDTVNNKTLTYFRLYWSGTTSGDRYVEGSGYLSALAPTVSPDSPVWTSPITIEVVGDFVTGTVS